MRTREGEFGVETAAEVAPDGEALVHAPCLPGFSVRVSRDAPRLTAVRCGLEEYGRWLIDRDLVGLTSETEALCAAVEQRSVGRVAIREAEAVVGFPVWVSGNAAALFAVDRLAASAAETAARLDFTRAALEEIGRLIGGLSDAQRGRRPDPPRRSIDETLTHVGNCVWWYASRLDDALPEPDDVPDEPPMTRCVRLFALVRPYLENLDPADRTRVYVPTRYPTSDPTEPWTHAKACRREAEHAWDHLIGLRRAARRARLPRP